MKTSLRAEHFAVFDEFLPPGMRERLWDYIWSDDLRPVDAKRGNGAFRKGDGSPLAGPSYLSEPIRSATSWRGFPSGGTMDLFISALREAVADFAPWVGRFAEDWRCFSARAYLYGSGHALSWHDDRSGRTGSYAYFVQPSWSANYGGELHIADASPRPVACKAPGPAGSEVRQGLVTRHLLTVGCGRFIVPKPNRLVVMSSGALHAVRRVETDAGDWVRGSISGFFLKPT
jgi:hypothetical protein